MSGPFSTWRRRWPDFGPIQIPPLPQQMLLEDEATGVFWLLSHDAAAGHVVITDTYALSLNGYHRYPKYDGPVVSNNPRLRLFIRNGHAGFYILDPIVFQKDRDNARVLTRRDEEAVSLEIDALAAEDPNSPTHVQWSDL